jgi:hypothetical protein
MKLSIDDKAQIMNSARQPKAQWEFAAPLPHTNAPPSRTMTYDSDNRLLTVNSGSVTVDNDGNLTSGPVTNISRQPMA